VFDPLTLALTFATVVQLVGQFKEEHGQTTVKDENEFMRWLASNHHDDVIRHLQQNSATVIAIKIALSQNHDVLIAMLRDIDRRLAMLAGSTIVLQPLAAAIYPDSQVSTEALEFLREFENSGSSEAMDFPTLREGALVIPIDGVGPTVQFKHSRWRFFEDDVSAMVRLDLLKLKMHPTKGNRIFVLTRKGAEMAKVLELDPIAPSGNNI